jgi:hypothetical protein
MHAQTSTTLDMLAYPLAPQSGGSLEAPLVSSPESREWSGQAALAPFVTVTVYGADPLIADMGQSTVDGDNCSLLAPTYNAR